MTSVKVNKQWRQTTLNWTQETAWDVCTESHRSITQSFIALQLPRASHPDSQHILFVLLPCVSSAKRVCLCIQCIFELHHLNNNHKPFVPRLAKCSKCICNEGTLCAVIHSCWLAWCCQLFLNSLFIHKNPAQSCSSMRITEQLWKY